MAARAETDVGLVGGSIEERLRHTRVPPLALPHVLAPFRRPGDAEPFAAFVGEGRLHVEIGFGRAHHLLDLAAAFPGDRVLGFETRREWVLAAARRAGRLGVDGVRVVEGDARPYLERLVPPGRVHATYILFPDPWWKRRHHKRRLFQPAFLDLLHRLTAPGGWLVAKTDVPAYADLMEASCAAHGGWRLVGTSADDPVLAALPASHREKKCAELGVPTFLHRFVKEPVP